MKVNYFAMYTFIVFFAVEIESISFQMDVFLPTNPFLSICIMSLNL